MEIWDLHCHLSGLPANTPKARLAKLLEFADRMDIGGSSDLCIPIAWSFTLFDPTIAAPSGPEACSSGWARLAVSIRSRSCLCSDFAAASNHPCADYGGQSGLPLRGADREAR